MKKFLAISAIIVLSGCNQREVDYLRSENEELRIENHRLEQKIETAQMNAENLQSEVDRFSDENWQDVVPDVENASHEVYDSLQ